MGGKALAQAGRQWPNEGGRSSKNTDPESHWYEHRYKFHIFRMSYWRFFRAFPLPLFSALSLLFAALQPARARQAGPTELYATASDGTPLHWVVYTPAGTGPWPAVLVIHGGGFRGGTPISSGGSIDCGNDLAAAGYIAFSIEYRLAPDGVLAGQVSDGRFPDQTDDVNLAILAARSDPRCNGHVGAVGGSAGGYHTAWAAVQGTPGEDRLDVGVSLSGAYDLSDFSPDNNLGGFIADVTNYLGVSTSETEALRAASPAFVADARTTPLLLVHSEEDSMPFAQLADMTNALDALGVTNYQVVTFPGSRHSFGNWAAIKDLALAFLAAGFSAPPAPISEPPPSETLLNVSTRARVESGTGVTIGGFIVTGDVPKPVVLRAIGPSLRNVGVTDALADPVLELYDGTGRLIAQNDNLSSLPPDRIPAGYKPGSGLESLIWTALPPGTYTAVMRGANGASGIGLFELYDLDSGSSRITNISTRGEAGSGADVMIGGFIVGGAEPTQVLLRAIGPSLSAVGIPNPLPDPVLEVYNPNGALLFANDNWRATQAQAISDSGLAPEDDRESAILATLAPGSYTAMLHDAGEGSGVALVEVYNLGSR